MASFLAFFSARQVPLLVGAPAAAGLASLANGGPPRHGRATSALGEAENDPRVDDDDDDDALSLAARGSAREPASHL